MQQRRDVYVADGWAPAFSTELITVEDPATEEAVATVPACGEDDAARAVAAARAARVPWATTAPKERASALRALAAGLRERQEEMAATITTEVGTPRRIAERIQAGLPPVVVDGYADLAESYTFETHVGNTLVVHEPVGVLAAITPWNYPLHQIVAKLAPAMAAGCPIIIKPSELTPLSAYLLFEILDTLDLPPGAVGLLPGYGHGAGEALVRHPGVDAVSFTGSVPAGRRVAELAAADVKHVTLELGGKSANVVLPDADLETAVKVGVSNAFLNGGQTCTAWTRMLVPEAKQDQVLELAATLAASFVPGDPTSPKTKLGPMASAAAAARVRSYVAGAVADGARLVAGGPERPEGLPRGHYVRATVLGDVDPGSTVAQEEVFGPVLSIIPFRDEEHALEIANNSDYGLHGAVWSADVDRAVRFARRMETGSVDVNGAAYNPLAPFGGRKRSGSGAEMGLAGLEELLVLKSIGIPA